MNPQLSNPPPTQVCSGPHARLCLRGTSYLDHLFPPTSLIQAPVTKPHYSRDQTSPSCGLSIETRKTQAWHVGLLPGQGLPCCVALDKPVAVSGVKLPICYLGWGKCLPRELQD